VASRNSLSSEYMTVLCASVTLRTSTMLLRLRAPTKRAMSSYAASKSLVVCCDALDCPRCTFSYCGASAV